MQQIIIVIIVFSSPKPKLVEQMLQYETVDVACGSSHIVAITCEDTVIQIPSSAFTCSS